MQQHAPALGSDPGAVQQLSIHRARRLHRQSAVAPRHMQSGEDPNERWRMNDASGATRQAAGWHESQMLQSRDCPEILPAAIRT